MPLAAMANGEANCVNMRVNIQEVGGLDYRWDEGRAGGQDEAR